MKLLTVLIPTDLPGVWMLLLECHKVNGWVGGGSGGGGGGGGGEGGALPNCDYRILIYFSSFISFLVNYDL